MIDEIKVGEKYLDGDGDVAEVLFIGMKSVFYGLSCDGKYAECNIPLQDAKEEWKPLPKELKEVKLYAYRTDDFEVKFLHTDTVCWTKHHRLPEADIVIKNGEIV